MAKKESSREIKWYERALLVLLILLPIIYISILLLQKRAVICTLSPQTDFSQWLYLAVFLAIYYLLLSLIRKAYNYIVYGISRNHSHVAEKDDQPAGVETVVPKPNVTMANVSKFNSILPIIIIIAVLIIGLLAMTGKITLPKIDTTNWSFDFSGKKSSCPATSAQTSTPCHSVNNSVGVSGVIVPDSCGCPSDTKFSQMDNITAGGPYKICVCK